MVSTEDKLLICCADLNASEKVRSQAHGILFQDLRWDVLIQKASRHGLAPLLYSFLSKSNDQRIPDEILNVLKNIFYANAVRNLKLERELIAILERFRRRSIDCIVLKGLFLLQSIYENIALRPMDDIDLLVHRNDLPKVHTALGELAYSFPSDSFPTRFYHHVHFHVVYVSAKPRVLAPVEVHWNIQDKFNALKIDIDQMWERAVPWNYGGSAALTMGPEDLLAYLCYHVDKHGCYSKFIRSYSDLDLQMVLGGNSHVRLLWYSEILKLVNLWGREFNWAAFTENCLHWGIESAVFSTLSWTNRIFGVSVAGEAMAELQPSKIRGFQARFYPRLLGIEGASHSDSHSFVDKLKLRIQGTLSTLHFRPLRLLDMVTYIFPDLKSISISCSSRGLPLYLRYVVHVCSASVHSMAYLVLLIYCVTKKYLSSRVRRTSVLRFGKWLRTNGYRQDGEEAHKT